MNIHENSQQEIEFTVYYYNHLEYDIKEKKLSVGQRIIKDRTVFLKYL